MNRNLPVLLDPATDCRPQLAVPRITLPCRCG